MDFLPALATVYRENPGQVLPNAFWKTLGFAEAATPRLTTADGLVSELALADAQTLYFYWGRDRRRWPFTTAEIQRQTWLLVHADYLPAVAGDFALRRPYFRLRLGAASPAPGAAPGGFALRSADPPREALAIADLIARCQPGLPIDATAIRALTTTPAYAADYWLWAIDTASGRPAGLVIADYDPVLREGCIEFLHVDPAYRRHGLGTWLVQAVAARLRQQAELVTVAGELQSATPAQGLYRRCGFVGADVWWLLRRKV